MEWHRRFARAARLPAALAGYLTNELGLGTSSDPAAEVGVWLKARGTSLTELVGVNGFTVVPGVQASSFLGLASADPEGKDVNGLARTWTAGMRLHAPRRPRGSSPVARGRWADVKYASQSRRRDARRADGEDVPVTLRAQGRRSTPGCRPQGAPCAR